MRRYDDTTTLRQIVEYGETAVRIAADRTEASLFEDEMFFHASVRLVTVIGEAVKRLSPAVRDAHPVVPWVKIAGMRDKLTHDYDEVDFPTLWQVLTERLPELLDHVRAILPEELPPPEEDPPKPPHLTSN